jgi:hypothetical protein
LESAPVTSDEAFVYERLEAVERRAAYLGGRFMGRSAREDGQTTEELLFDRIEEFVTPLDRPAQGALMPRHVTPAPGEEWQPTLESSQHLSRLKHFHASCGEFDCERKSVEASADLGHHAVSRKVWTDGRRSLVKEADRLVFGQRRDRKLPLSSDVQRFSARRQHSQSRASAQDRGDVGGGCRNLLEVIEREEHLPIAHVFR